MHQFMPQPRDQPPAIPTPDDLQVDQQRRRPLGVSGRLGPRQHVELHALVLSAKDTAHDHRLHMRGDQGGLVKPRRKQLGKPELTEVPGRKVVKGRGALFGGPLATIQGAALRMERLRHASVNRALLSAQLKKDRLFRK
jgi:hypothetical protein